MFVSRWQFSKWSTERWKRRAALCGNSRHICRMSMSNIHGSRSTQLARNKLYQHSINQVLIVKISQPRQLLPQYFRTASSPCELHLSARSHLQAVKQCCRQCEAVETRWTCGWCPQQREHDGMRSDPEAAQRARSAESGLTDGKRSACFSRKGQHRLTASSRKKTN